MTTVCAKVFKRHQKVGGICRREAYYLEGSWLFRITDLRHPSTGDEVSLAGWDAQTLLILKALKDNQSALLYV